MARLESALLDQLELLRPGFTRVSLPYFATTDEVDFVLNAVRAVADHGFASRLSPLTRWAQGQHQGFAGPKSNPSSRAADASCLGQLVPCAQS